MQSPLVSILIPVYNVETYLSQCIDSILIQTYTNLQVVLVDDGSTDGSWKVCKKYADKDDRIEVFHKGNSGVADTRNFLLDKVRGGYVLFVDSDDWIDADMVEALMTIACKNDADIVICENVINDVTCDKRAADIKVLNQNEAIALFLEHKELRGSLWNKLFKTSLLHNIRFHYGISLGEDALFCWEVLQRASNVMRTENQYYHYRMLETSLTHSTFGPKKLSAYNVWHKISCDTHILWPQYEDIARSRFCIEMILLLRDAAKSKYSRNESIQILQDVVKNNIYSIHKTHMSSWKMTVYGYLVAYCYNIVKLLS